MLRANLPYRLVLAASSVAANSIRALFYARGVALTVGDGDTLAPGAGLALAPGAGLALELGLGLGEFITVGRGVSNGVTTPT